MLSMKCAGFKLKHWQSLQARGVAVGCGHSILASSPGFHQEQRPGWSSRALQERALGLAVQLQQLYRRNGEG